MFSHLDSPSMHFAVGMFCTAVLCAPILLKRPHWWPLIPLIQSFGGVFALVPDFTIALSFYPRLFSWLGNMQDVRAALHRDIGNIFFFHAAIDNSGEGNFLRGFVLTALQYNLWICVFVANYYFARRARTRELRQTLSKREVYGGGEDV